MPKLRTPRWCTMKGVRRIATGAYAIRLSTLVTELAITCPRREVGDRGGGGFASGGFSRLVDSFVRMGADALGSNIFVQMEGGCVMRPQTSYIILVTTRSGSTLLCEALDGTNIAGHPDEYFTPGNSTLRKPFWREDHEHLTFMEYIERVLDAGTTPNGVFGTKCGILELHRIERELRRLPGNEQLPLYELFSTVFPNLHFVWVTRRDKIRQAVSVAKAMQTNA